jgi:hypothetical protein
MYRISLKKDFKAIFAYKENAPLKIVHTDKWMDTSFFLKPLEIE